MILYSRTIEDHVHISVMIDCISGHIVFLEAGIQRQNRNLKIFQKIDLRRDLSGIG